MDHEWLDRLMSKLSGVYADEFTFEHVITEEEYHEKHGSCMRVTYRLVFNPALPSHNRRLPVDEGKILMKLIKNAAKNEEARLVTTKTKGQHDFCDWGWSPEGEAFVWVFLQLEDEIDELPSDEIYDDDDFVDNDEMIEDEDG